MSISPLVEFCWLDTVIEQKRCRGRFERVHFHRVPGYRQQDGTEVVSNSVVEFLQRLVADKLFRQSMFMKQCPFDEIQLWLWDSTIPLDKQGYDLPEVTSSALKLQSFVPESRLKAVYVRPDGARRSEMENWLVVAETLMQSLFIEFMDMPEVPLYFIKEPKIDLSQRIVPSVDIYPKTQGQALVFDSITAMTRYDTGK
ncbi:MAG: hypothetical protein AAFU71_13470 [Cyanobacteria bacterium J06632_22]